MARKKKEQTFMEGLSGIEVQYATFGVRLRQIRKERGLSQEDFAQVLGTSKQILSRYELEQRSPRIEVVRKYAERLQVSVDYLLGDTEAEAVSNDLCIQMSGKPFYQIFIEVTHDQMGLDIPGIVRVTGLTDRQVRTIITRQMKDAPLPIALRLSETMNVPLEVWAGGKAYTPKEVSVEAYEVARAYDKAELREKNTIRVLLGLGLLKEETV